MTADVALAASLALGVVAVGLGLVVMVAVREVRVAMAVALDLLLAAGLLRLTTVETWPAIGAVAAVVVVRSVVAQGIRTAAAARAGPG